MIRVCGANSTQGKPRRGSGIGQLRHFVLLVAVPIVCALLGPSGLYAQNSKPKEYEVKAAYLYNFGKFVEWPAAVSAAEGDSFAICVLGQDPFGPALDATISSETIGGKRVVARRISKAQEALTCRVLFVSSSEDLRLKEILATVEKAPVLTVSDIPQFSRRGGMMQFIQEGSRIRFEVNLTPAQEAGLTLSSELLKVAVAVRRKNQPGD